MFKIKKTLIIDHTCEDWELFEDTPSCIARQLNDATRRATEICATYDAALEKASETFFKIDGYGTSDTEPIGELEYILEKFYGV